MNRKRSGGRRPALVFVMAVCLTAVLGVTPVLAQDSIVRLKEEIIELQNRSELGFRSLVLCSEVVSFGRYTPYPSAQVKAGSSVHFYYEPENLYTEMTEGLYILEFTQDLLLESTDGAVLIDAPELLEFRYESASPVLDVFAHNTLNLQGLEAGRYVLTMVMHDKLGDKEAKTEYAFEIVE